MSAVNQLRAGNPQDFIARKYMDQVLEEAGAELFADQERIASGSAVDLTEVLKKRRFTVSEGRLRLTHPIQERFVDMRPRYRNQQRVQIHNSQIWTQFNIIAGKVAYGFTENIRRLIAQRYQIDIHG